MKKLMKDLATQAGQGIGIEEEWVKKGTGILQQLNQLLYQYRIIRGEVLPETPQSRISQFTDPKTLPSPKPNPDKGGIQADKLLVFLNQFLANCQSQGMGKTPIGEVISKIPLTVDQLSVIMAMQQQKKEG